MKKLMALCLAMLMVLSMVSFSVMAEETAEAVLFEDISNGQLQNFILSDLAIPTGATVTSSNPVVISETGKVTRPLFEDAAVTLTVNGTAFELTVKSKKIIGSTETLTFENAETGSSLLGTTGWPASLGSIAGGTNGSVQIPGTATVAESATGNKYAKLGIAVNYGTCGYTFQTVPAINNAEKIVLEFDLGFETQKGCFNYDLTINGKDVARLVYLPTYYIYSWDLTANSTWHGSDRSPAKGAPVGDTNLQHVVITVNKVDRTVDFTVGGTQLDSRAVITSADSLDLSNITSIKFVPKGRDTRTATEWTMVDKDGDGVAESKGSAISWEETLNNHTYIDNVVVYGETTDRATILASATPAEKLAYYSTLLDKDYVANGGNLDALANNLKFTSDEALPEGVTLTWTSTDPAIASDGTVKRPVLEAATATITGTLTVGEASVTKSYNVTILPLTMAGQSEMVDFDSYGLADGQAISGAGWTIQSGTAVTNVVENGNSYAKIKTTSSFGSERVKYDFASFPTSAERYYVMKFKFKSNAKPNTVYNIGLSLNTKQIANFVQKSGNVGMYGNNWGSGGAWYGTPASSDYFTTPTTFTELTIEIDKQENAIRYYVGDTLKNTTYFNGHASAGVNAAKNVDLSTITSANLHINWRRDGSADEAGEFCIDDVQFYAPQSVEGIIPTLSDADKVNFYKQLIEASNIGTATAVGTALDLDNGYADYDPATYGVTVDWASDNTAYIANDGTVTKLAPHGTTATVNMTATITAGEASDTVTLPVTVGTETTLIDSVDFSDTTLEIGSKATYGTDADEAYGSILTMTNPTEGTHKASGTIVTYTDSNKVTHYMPGVTGAGRYDRVIFEADMKYTDDGASFASGGIGLKTIAGKAGINVYLNYTTKKVQLTTTAAQANAAATGLEATASKTIYYPMPAAILAKGEGAWVHLMIDHNVLSQTYNVYLDGILINEVPILQAEMDLGSNAGSAIRSYSLELSGKGTVCVDNLELYKYTDANAVEVNAALNAALIQFASDIQSPVLVNQDLPAMTIGSSWVTGSRFNRDLSDSSALKPTNVSTYTYVTDGPQVTYAIDGQAVTAVNVVSPKEVQLTITATANGITESKTVTRKVAPVAIRSLALGTASCLNGAWIQGADGTEKLIVAKYLEDKLVGADVVDFADTAEYDSLTGTGDRFDEANSLANNLSTSHPNEMAEYDQLKIFVVDADGITPLAYVNAELHD